MDLVTFRGGLAHYGTKLPACVRQQPVYGISKYGDLDPLLGKGWYLRVLNKGGDFCYCAKESVQLYLHRRKSVEEVDQDGKVVRCLGGGYILILSLCVWMVLVHSIQLFVKCSNTTIIACVYRLSSFSTILTALFKATNSQLIITT